MSIPGLNSLSSFLVLSLGLAGLATRAEPVGLLVGAEFAIDQPMEGPSPCTRAAPAVARGETNSLMVWTHGKGPSTDPAVYAARLGADGTLLDPYGILISKTAGEQTVCTVAANPGGFLVVWSAPHGTSTTDWDILGARVQADGTLLDPTPLPVCALASSIQTSPTVAGNGDSYLVAWRDSRSTGIYGTLVFSNGGMLTTNGFPICTAANDQFTPMVAALGTNYLAVWQDYRKATSNKYVPGIFGARISGSGVLIDTNGLAISTPTNSLYRPAVAGGATNYLVVWEAYDLGGNDIYGARLSAEGTVLDPDGLQISHGGNLQTRPVVTATSDGFLVAWQDYRGSGTNSFGAAVYGTRVGGDGTVLDLEAIPLGTSPGGETSPAIAARGHEALALWQDFRNNPDTVLSDIYGTRLDLNSNALVGSGFAANRTVNAQWHPAVAPCGTNLLVVWADNRNGTSPGSRIYGARLTPDGTNLDPTAIPVCTAPNRQTDPAVAANGGHCLVVWSHWPESSSTFQVADVYGAIVNEDGRVMQPGGFPIAAAADDQVLPAVAALGTGFLVVWQDARNRGSAGTHQDIYGTRVSLDGVVLDPDGIAICKDTATHLTPAVAGSGAQALVVWTHYRSTLSDIYGARVDDLGRLLDPNALAICRAANLQLTPTVAANGSGYFVAWTDRRSTANSSDIYAARVGLDGLVQPTDGFALRSGAGNQTAPAAVAQGPDYVLVWQEPRGTRPELYDVLGTWVSGDGLGVSGPAMVIAHDSLDHARPAIAAGATGPVLVASQALQYSAARVAANLFNFQGVPRLRLVAATEDGQPTLSLRGAPGGHYTIEKSSDLRTWAPIQTLTLSESPALWTDSTSTNIFKGFYRAGLQP
jgi:hypothetical protein